MQFESLKIVYLSKIQKQNNQLLVGLITIKEWEHLTEIDISGVNKNATIVDVQSVPSIAVIEIFNIVKGSHVRDKFPYKGRPLVLA